MQPTQNLVATVEEKCKYNAVAHKYIYIATHQYTFLYLISNCSMAVMSVHNTATVEAPGAEGYFNIFSFNVAINE